MPSVAADTNGTAIAINLISNLIFGGLVALARWLVLVVAGVDPRRRRLSLVIVVLLWLICNGIYFSLGLPNYTLFLLVTTLVCGWVCYRELDQFWRVDLVGVDARIRDGLGHERSLQMCTTSLDFLGIGAAKLTNNQAVFQAAIDRCDRPGRPVRLLLSRPDNEGLRMAAVRAGTDPHAYQVKVQRSLETVAQLKAQEKNIRVRFYKDFPAFRLMFINDEVCLASHYVLGKGEGSDLPQLHIVKTSGSRDVTSLYYAFHEYFESIWDESEDWDFKWYPSA